MRRIVRVAVMALAFGVSAAAEAQPPAAAAPLALGELKRLAGLNPAP